MKRIIINSFGGAEVLSVVDDSMPQPANEQVLIKMMGAGVNPIDYKIRDGSSFVAKLFKDALPISLGYELSGEVVALGAQASPFKTGDRVCGMLSLSQAPVCYAEYITANINEIALVPQSLNLTDMGALPLAGLTALQAIELAQLKPNQRVLIHAAAGGVGHLAVQLAKIKGAYVIATASKHNHDFLVKLGVDQCIDYRTESFVDVAKLVDVVIDLVGGDVGIQSLDILVPNGKQISIPSINIDKILECAKLRNLDVNGMLVTPNKKDLSYLLNLIQDKKIHLHISQYFSLEDVAKAHRLLESKHAVGKILLKAKEL